ncbi:MAG: OmpA family protein [Spirochaetes bacterium]|nr:OmpA family protein [Spirochaetota bacterium]
MTGLCSIIVCAALLAPPDGVASGDSARKLRFIHRQGEKYRIVTEVKEDVLINGVLSHSTDILNKVSVDTVEASGDAGILECRFMVSEVIKGKFKSYFLKLDYPSRFRRDGLGVFTIDGRYYMPVVRNLPRFPEGEVRPGDVWAGDGEETHDLRRGYGMEGPFRFPFSARYSYLRDEVKEGVNTAVFDVNYAVFHRVPSAKAPARAVPVRIMGASKQTFWWDVGAGLMHSYIEEFDYLFLLSNGSQVEYRGTARGRLIRSAPLDRDRAAGELAESIKKEGIDDVSIRKEEGGITLVLENVMFQPNSDELTDGERTKLGRLAGILRNFPDRDLLITGHTARVGDEASSRRLSERRAQAVADFLISREAADRPRVVTRGMGSREPLGDNETEAGRRRNRRVEITILEN